MNERVFHLKMTLHEPLFHASYEYNTEYLTEAVISNYALAFAFGMAKSQRRIEDAPMRPRYKEDLNTLLEKNIYFFPAVPSSSQAVNYHQERWNVIGEGLRYQMGQGCIVDDLDFLVGGVRARAVNKPQQGYIRYVSRGSLFTSWCVVKNNEHISFPTWIRLGKTMAKTHCEIQEIPCMKKNGSFYFSGGLNSVDVANHSNIDSYDIINIRPAPILKNIRAHGEYLETKEANIPNNVFWNFPT
ncbi:type I-D CRISPR-associated protein Cas5/Csc1 [Pigmentibacter sp. JX0631]|uniref:type I-D CRISPR-associated protein Cas5/Csc1 n=1 Tax=Pigmentibacter sp. JX0631 TaxID=2976982 RepID=UPI002469A351|nr:type I-D CRISPR-associated protein Cas5/Csc1 [Pigmentibacter sp. JX0631]WGL60030.1 type I-D CRISPR-associated protein Cas5/Csc1 [Pigmentibacter sp. JX0631]